MSSLCSAISRTYLQYVFIISGRCAPRMHDDRMEVYIASNIEVLVYVQTSQHAFKSKMIFR